jgi:hypothetical protein
MAELNATEGGDFINVPFWKANLTGDFEVLSDSSSLTPGKITADKQVGVILHRGRAFEARDLAALAAGSDPMAAIGAKVADYVANQRQKDLLSCLAGVFGSLNTNSSSSAFFDLCIDSESGDTPTALSPRHVAEARAILGDQGDKLTAVAMHSKVYYDLVERRAIDYVTAGEARTATDNQTPDVFAGSIQNAFGLAPNTRLTFSRKARSRPAKCWQCRPKLIVTSSLRAMPCQSTCITCTTRLVHGLAPR